MQSGAAEGSSIRDVSNEDGSRLGVLGHHEVGKAIVAVGVVPNTFGDSSVKGSKGGSLSALFGENERKRQIEGGSCR